MFGAPCARGGPAAAWNSNNVLATRVRSFQFIKRARAALDREDSVGGEARKDCSPLLHVAPGKENIAASIEVGSGSWI